MKKNIIILVFTALTNIHANAQQETYRLYDLMEDTKKYQTTNTSFHAGNLYEHSLWVAITVNEWCEHNEEWAEGLNKDDRKLAILGGLLHDIGKGGDLMFNYYTKPDHPEKGQKYLLGKENYVLCNGQIFNFQKCFAAMGLSETDRKIVSILAGAHHAFGDLLQKLVSIDIHTAQNNELKPYIDTFKKRLQKFAKAADYKKTIDTRLIKLVLLVSAADVRGAQPCCCNHSFDLADYNVTTSPTLVHPTAADKFKEFAYETRGKILKKIIENFGE